MPPPPSSIQGQLAAGDTVEVTVCESEPAKGGGLDDSERGVLVRRMAAEEHTGSAAVLAGAGDGDGGGDDVDTPCSVPGPDRCQGESRRT